MIQINRNGVTRTVLLTKNYAIKIPNIFDGWKLFLLGILGNLQEIEFSKTRWKILCPIFFYLPLGLLIVMPKCQTLLTPLTKKQYRKIINKKDYILPVENKKDSWGIYKNQLVAIDYGSGI